MKKVLLISLAAMAATSAFADIYVGGGVTIPDNIPAGVTTTVNVTTGVTSVNFVELRTLTHTWVGDLTVTLTNPDAVSVDIFRRVGSFTTTGVGDSSNLDGVYNFTTGGPSFLTESLNGTSAYIMASGNYAASTNTFDTVSAASSHVPTNLNSLATGTAGIWTLTISDSAGGDLGSLGAWALDVTPDAVPEPATMVVLGAAALAAAARKRRK